MLGRLSLQAARVETLCESMPADADFLHVPPKAKSATGGRKPVALIQLVVVVEMGHCTGVPLGIPILVSNA